MWIWAHAALRRIVFSQSTSERVDTGPISEWFLGGSLKVQWLAKAHVEGTHTSNHHAFKKVKHGQIILRAPMCIKQYSVHSHSWTLTNTVCLLTNLQPVKQCWKVFSYSIVSLHEHTGETHTQKSTKCPFPYILAWHCHRVSQIQLFYTHKVACQYWFLSKYVSRLQKYKRESACQERRMTRWLNKHSHQLMGAWVKEKGSKWENRWRHKRERRERER